MKIVICTTLIMLTLAFAGCSRVRAPNDYGHVLSENETDENTWNLLAGKWLGERQRKDGSIHKWLTERKNDGTYTMVFFDGDQKSIEVGEWGVSSNIEFMIFKGWIKNGVLKPALPQDHWTRDAYEIIKLTDHEFECRSLETGNIYNANRVSDDYEL